MLLLSLVLLGYLRTLRSLRNANEQRSFAETYLTDLTEYCESKGADDHIYEGLTRRANRMQNSLGEQGILSHFKPGGANQMFTNLPVIINLLPLLHSYFADSWLKDRPVAFQTYSAIREAILRYVGSLDDLIDLMTDELKNPFKQLQKGIRIVILTPIDVLTSFGILSSEKHDRVHQSRWIRLISGVVSLITLLSALVTIAAGWSAVKNLLD